MRKGVEKKKCDLLKCVGTIREGLRTVGKKGKKRKRPVKEKGMAKLIGGDGLGGVQRLFTVEVVEGI